MKRAVLAYRCRGCRTVTPETLMLTADNPFEPGEIIVGCPYCKSVDSFDVVCDEEGCSEPWSCGTSTPDGYRGTCHTHAPRSPK